MDLIKKYPGLACITAGALTATGFAPLNWWPATLIGLAIYAWATFEANRTGQAVWRGWLFGVGLFTVGNNWIAHAFTYQDAMPHWLGYGAVIALALFLAIYPAIAAFIARYIGRGSAVGYAIALAGAWIISEYLRAVIFTGFAWNPVGVVTLSVANFPHASRWVGTYGLSGLVVFTATMLWLLTRGERALPLGTFAVLMVVAAIGLFSPTSPTQFRKDMPELVVVQPNIDQQVKHDPAFERENYARLADLTGQPGRDRRLILWPEAAVPDYLEEDAIARSKLASLLGPNDILLTGAIGLNYDKNGQYISGHNSFYALNVSGQLTARFDKAHLVPFGEYLPLRPILEPIGVSRLVPGSIDFIPGPGPVTVDVPGIGPIGGQICYEMIFSGEVVQKGKRPAFIFNPSNDAWFGAWGPPQHLAQAQMRAVEEAVPIIRSTPTGISAVIDSDGRIVKSLAHKTAGRIVSKVPVAGSPGLFAQYGNMVPLILAALFLFLGVAIARSGRYGDRI